MNEIVPSLAYLYFSIMKSDNSIHEDERKMLHEILDTNWKKISQKGDPFGAMGMELIESMVMDLDEGEVKPQEAFDYFRSVFFKRKAEFDSNLRAFILESSIQLAGSFNRMNKHELVLLSKLEILLKD